MGYVSERNERKWALNKQQNNSISVILLSVKFTYISHVCHVIDWKSLLITIQLYTGTTQHIFKQASLALRPLLLD